ncbi:hypothetical protein, partial [Niabella drilacis]
MHICGIGERKKRGTTIEDTIPHGLHGFPQKDFKNLCTPAESVRKRNEEQLSKTPSLTDYADFHRRILKNLCTSAESVRERNEEQLSKTPSLTDYTDFHRRLQKSVYTCGFGEKKKRGTIIEDAIPHGLHGFPQKSSKNLCTSAESVRKRNEEQLSKTPSLTDYADFHRRILKNLCTSAESVR